MIIFRYTPLLCTGIRLVGVRIAKDIVAAVVEFFVSGTFPRGCNSSFIALIPKTQDAKVVKDFRPISLIGSLYKIIANILVNRLSFVISDLISDVQSSFVFDRQVFDGPFIFNKLLSWFKHKKFKVIVFKVDFEKDFDSIRWDYLNNVLRSLGLVKDSAVGLMVVSNLPWVWSLLMEALP
nr:RNA-directed DNA polymerase, eukaryota, reverse transcriptase zinc-binding domain protein [Tanacetum cinerariifolium]